jgi:uncharacterized protein involved in response to NO
MVQNVAFILIGIGVLSLVGWALQAFFTSSEVHILIRIAVGAIGVGALILILVAIKDRITKGKKEEFKEVDK